MERFKDALRHVGEFGLVFAYLAAAIGEINYAEPVIEGVLGFLFSNYQVAVVYAVWFIAMALSLLISGMLRLQKLHKYSLAAMYLTTIYTMSLAIGLFGFGDADILDDAIIGTVAAACWLRWKLKTEYVDWNEFSSDDYFKEG